MASTILDLDTDQLRSAVSVAETANNEITQAMNSLNNVVVHNDWICPERNSINNYTVKNKETAAQIQSNSSSFYDAIKRSSELFDETEQSSITKTNGVDSLISGIVNVVRGTFNTGGSEPAMTTFIGLSGLLKGKSSGGGGHSF